MKRKNRLIISALAIIMLSLIVIMQSPLNRQTIPTRFIAGENMGFDLGPGNLNFGLIVPGYSASRQITITNTQTHPTLTKIKSSGEISKYIIVSDNNFILDSGESKNITFSCYPEKGLELREYPGKIIMTTYKA